MLDIKWLRENREVFLEGMDKRGAREKMSALFNEVVACDKSRRVLSTQRDEMKASQNRAGKEIPQFKKQGRDVAPLMEEMKKLSQSIKEISAQISEVEAKQREILLQIPNIPHQTVAKGKDEQSNQEVRRWGEPPSFSFAPKPHWDLGRELDILDAETAAKVTGARFHFYKGAGARLERAIINFFMDSHAKKGYTEVLPPYLVNRASMTGTGQLPKFENDAFKVVDTDYFLIPTAEVPVTNIYRDSILKGSELPICFAAYSACFRSEAGSAGRDVRGLIRQHQFNKVELVKFSRPEDSYEQLEMLTRDAEDVLKALGLAYRVVSLCGGDLGFSSAKTYDIEVWLPSYQDYKEISSCSNFEDYQARRANIRFKDNAKDKTRFVHTLNGSGVAVGRTVAAVFENYQNEDGSITVPEALRPYMGIDVIAPKE